MRFGQKLQSKLLILVAVPLLFEFAFVGTLVVVQSRVEQEANRLARSKTNVATINDVLKQLHDAGSSVLYYVLAGNQRALERYTKAVEQSHTDIAELRQDYQNDPHKLQLLDQIEETENKLVAFMNRPKQATDAGNRLWIMTETRGLGENVWRLTERIANTSYQLLREENQIQQLAPASELYWRKILMACLITGVALSAVMAILLANVINLDIIRRLLTVVDNTSRIAGGTELNARIGGRDEISQLDSAVHRMAQILEEAERKEKAIVENAADVICAFDLEGKFTFVSPACKTMWGYDENELLGNRLARFIPEKDLQANPTFIEDSKYQERRPLAWESRFKKADNTTADVLWSVMWSEPDKTYFCVAHDATEKRRIERFRKEFLAMVGHDLRTPLTSVQLFLTLLAEGAYENIPDDVKTKAQLAEFDVSRLIRLVTNLLDIEKTEAGKMEFELQPVSALSIVEKGIGSVKPLAEARGVKIELSGKDATIKADEPRLVQVVVNLLANAISFSPPKQTVEVQIIDHQDNVEIRVQDHGKGIPESAKDRIFQRFEQVNDADSKTRVSSGLGLSICKAIVDGHHGEIGFESGNTPGSTFWFKIPAH
jgi:PAS domain S-box-containing protein